MKRVRTYHHTPSPTSTQQHPPFILKPTSGTGFCEKRYHPLDAPLTPNPPSPRLVKVDEAICKCPSRAKKGTTHACLSRACHYSALIHLREGWPGIKNMDHWMVSFFAKTGKENQCLSRGQDSCLFDSISYCIFFRNRGKGKSVPLSSQLF